MSTPLAKRCLQALWLTIRTTHSNGQAVCRLVPGLGLRMDRTQDVARQMSAVRGAVSLRGRSDGGGSEAQRSSVGRFDMTTPPGRVTSAVDRPPSGQPRIGLPSVPARTRRVHYDDEDRRHGAEDHKHDQRGSRSTHQSSRSRIDQSQPCSEGCLIRQNGLLCPS
jgi:hypothetical protein